MTSFYKKNGVEKAVWLPETTVIEDEEEEEDEAWEKSRTMSTYRCRDFRSVAGLAICTVQSPLPHGKLHLPGFGLIQE